VDAAGWAATDYSKPGSGLSPLHVSLQSRSSLSHHASPHAAATHRGLSGAGTRTDEHRRTDRRVEIGGRPG